MLLIHGDNSWASFNRYKDVKRTALEKGYEIITIDGDELNDIGSLQIHTEALDMFGAKRIIFVKRLSSNRKSTVVKDFVEFIKKSNISVEIVLWEEKAVPKNFNLYKIFKDKFKVEEFSILKKFDLERWGREFLKKEGVDLDQKQITIFFELCNYDQATIASEANKLKSIGKDVNIADLISNGSTIQIWGFIDNFIPAVLNKDASNKSKVYDMYKRLISQEENDILIHTLLLRQVRILIRVKLLLNDSFNTSQLVSALKLPPFKVGDYVSQSSQFELNQLVHLFEELIKCEEKLKTGRSDYPILETILNI